MDKKNQLDVTFCILYFSSNSCSTCFGQPCAHHQELTASMDALPANRSWQPPCSHGTYQHEAIISRSRQLLMMDTWLPETCWATIIREIKNTKSDIWLVFLIHTELRCTVNHTSEMHVCTYYHHCSRSLHLNMLLRPASGIRIDSHHGASDYVIATPVKTFYTNMKPTTRRSVSCYRHMRYTTEKQ